MKKRENKCTFSCFGVRPIYVVEVEWSFVQHVTANEQMSTSMREFLNIYIEVVLSFNFLVPLL